MKDDWEDDSLYYTQHPLMGLYFCWQKHLAKMVGSIFVFSVATVW